ncbi:iron-siderophore ABC transporter substrate-binding protein [Microbacterium sp. cx-55]|uniref:iron-siderophore ABC transporter substrate-binding protein n=1 Tax=unclassified Microbacterium TaxID=2609290 RepID=UPI001CBAC4DF|nr:MULTISPECIES: iron-siderophore ABC transporter substrate-binding protein [unclassified Microbacterium]MCC4907465.1 iron-siderophore ABC transporter substrate-binding protein [Microbacterium sp. cx-59]UGB36538.1 iron-siderophore ABC transporter substrate-binding protein [Microbacterium sp. cx-55]
MSRTRSALVAVAAAALLLTGCSTGASSTTSTDSAAAPDGAFPVTIENAFGETTIDAQPERVVTLDWGNQDAALALGVVPVAMPKVTYGDEDGDGLLPWTKAKLDELGAETPVLMDETDGYDYEAIADARPDVILAAYSGMTQEQYDTLTKIAPVVTYQDVAWGTSWQDMTILDGTALGLEQEAKDLVTSLEDHVTTEAAKYPALAGKNFLLTYYDPTDLSNVNYYSTRDPRVGFLEEMGLGSAAYVAEQSDASETFWFQTSAEQIEDFQDVQLIVAYGSDDMVATLQADPLLSRIPAVADGAIAIIDSATTLSTVITPSPLTIGSAEGDDYIRVVGEAAEKAS